ncbi:hypothetical protein KFK09_002491 [Dendrobium nobile]|uniref:Uncharacterized protein n=1 Tax=Dendrobium nobile TaxID=94219 RepID=A0A8T3C3V3_DENNO|nr:hypothetical protein KFK09_002491 [Dendrobium nobile]
MRDMVHSYADLIHRVEAQISADEVINAHKKQFEQTTEKHKNAPGMGDSSSQRKKQGGKNLPPRPSQSRREPRAEKEYTPLNTSRANVLMAIRDEESVKWPNPIKSNSGNQEQYCHFHRSCGHTTEACKQLKEEIERLIRQGYLGRFIANPPGCKDTPPAGGQPTQRQPQNNRQMVGEIDTIAGGPLLSNQVLLAMNEEPA